MLRNRPLTVSGNFLRPLACMRPFAILAVLLPAIAFADVTGPARVIDGDTLEVAGQRVRLHGVDAPELAQTCRDRNGEYPCGRVARAAVLDLIASEDTVTCKTRGKDRYGRWLAVCFAGGFSINRNIVFTGWALAYRRYSTDYVETEDGAREAKRGLWRGKFVPPWEWRRGKRLAKPAEGPKIKREHEGGNGGY